MQAYGEGLPSRVFAMTERPGQDFSQGAVMTTGRDLDVTVEGDGWLAVLDPSGQEAYTRAGHLKIDQTGMLQNSNGNLMLGENGGPIFIPLPISKIEIGNDGTISVLPQARRLKQWKPWIGLSWFAQIIVMSIKMLTVYSNLRPPVKYSMPMRA